MKRCPECGRDYNDDSLSFCLDDGSELLFGPARAERSTSWGEFLRTDEPATIMLPESGAAAVGLPAAELSIVTSPSPDAGNSIAVLPFKNISADADNEYFCEGLAEELLNALAKIGDLRVAARTSAFSFKDKKTDIGEIGQKLGVANVLEGSVRKSGDRLRIAVQLLSASDGYHVWSETYDREMRDIFDVQDEITLAVIDALKLKLLGNAKTSLLKRETENPEAYKAYLRGRYLRYAKNDHRGAALAYEDAVRLDPSHAPSWLGVAETCVLQAHYAIIHPREACSKVRAAIATARALQGESAEAFYIEGFTAFIEQDWPACDIAYRRAIEMEPDNSRSLGTFGVINCILGRVAEAVELFGRARAADPLAAYPYAMTGTGFVAARQLKEAMPFFDQAFEFEKDQTLALWTYSVANVALGKFDEGIAAAERSVAVSHRTGFFLGLLGWAFAAAGQTEKAKEILEEVRSRPVGSPIQVFEACLLGALDDKDAAFDLLSQAVEELAPMARYVGLPCFDSLRDDPRFKDLLKRMNLPE